MLLYGGVFLHHFAEYVFLGHRKPALTSLIGRGEFLKGILVSLEQLVKYVNSLVTALSVKISGLHRCEQQSKQRSEYGNTDIEVRFHFEEMQDKR